MESPNPYISSTKRPRPSDSDEIVLDNYHSHKRYLTEVMSCSLNGLKMADNGRRSGPASGSGSGGSLLMDFIGSIGPTETPSVSGRSVSPFPSHGDDMSTHDSTMSDDSEDSVGWRAANGYDISPIPQNSSISNRSKSGSPPSPGSPNRTRKLMSKSSPSRSHSPTHGPPWGPQSLRSSVNPWGSPNQRVAHIPLGGQGPPYSLTHSQTRPSSIPNHKGMNSSRHLADTVDGKLPPSPSDPNQCANLRRAALLRALQMRTQPQLVNNSGNGSETESMAIGGEEEGGGGNLETGRKNCSGSLGVSSKPTTSGLHPSMLSLTSYMPEAHKGLSASSYMKNEVNVDTPIIGLHSRNVVSGDLSASALGRSCGDKLTEKSGEGTSGDLNTLTESETDTWNNLSDVLLHGTGDMEGRTGHGEDGEETGCSREALRQNVGPVFKSVIGNIPELGRGKVPQRLVMREKGYRVKSEQTGSSLVGFCSDSVSCFRGEVDSGTFTCEGLTPVTHKESKMSVGVGSSDNLDDYNRQPGKRSTVWRLTNDKEMKPFSKRPARGGHLGLLRQNSSSICSPEQFAFPVFAKGNDDGDGVETLSPTSKGSVHDFGAEKSTDDIQFSPSQSLSESGGMS